ncbi:PREDICTED: calphotin-like [Acropora digitifera]|uniref:calphotin-like n=1 Tax=Acropora digitifera TaxID=70779 RepID=UPI00077A1302|nr:PREDICTED: calphotin-like [Acropora digitifera]
MEQSSPSSSIVASVPVSAQRTLSSVPRESGHVMEELPRSSPKAPTVSAPVSVPVKSVTVSAAPATVTVSASPVTVPVSAIVSVAPVTVTAPAPATVTASSAMVTASVPPTVTAPGPTSSSGIVPTSQVSVTPSTASSVHDFPKFSGYQDTVDSKSRAYIRKCMTKEISGVDIDVLRTWSSKNIAHFSSWMIKNYNIPEGFKGFSLEMAGHLGKEFKSP